MTNQPDDLNWSRRLSIHAGSLIESAKGCDDRDPAALTNADARSYGEMLNEVREHLEAQAATIKELKAEVESFRGCLATTCGKLMAAEARATKAEEALRRIAEGNLGDMSWQANYDRIRQVAREALGEEKA